MGTIITKKYSHLAEKKGLAKVWHLGIAFFPLVKDVIKSGKLREISSFAIWEGMHKANLFSSYVRFEKGEPFVLEEGMDLENLEFSELAERLQLKIQKILNWKVYHRDSNGVIYGCLASENSVMYKSIDGVHLEKLHDFKREIKAVFISQEDIIFVNPKGAIYRSDDSGKSFHLAMNLSEEESSIFHHYGMTQTPDGLLLIGEYGNVAKEGRWANIAYIYGSTDLGKSWERSDFLKKQGVNKHVHMIKYSKLLDRLILADGDNKKQLWISKDLQHFQFSKNPWDLRTHFHIQMGGYTSMTESGENLIFGTDYLGGTNFLVTTKDGKHFQKSAFPDPFRRAPVHDLQKREGEKGEEIWAVLNNPNSSKARSLLMVSRNGGQSWRRVIEYDGTKHLIMINSGTLKEQEKLSFALTAMVQDGGAKGVCYEIS